VSVLSAAALYLVGFYLPLLTSGGESVSLSDGEGLLAVVWVVPAAVAAVAGFIALKGSPIAAAVGTGIITGLAGITVFELVLFHKIGDDSSASKGVGYFCLLAAAASSVGAVISSFANRAPEEAKCHQAWCLAGAAAAVGVSLALLLPKNGYSVFDIEDGLVKVGMLTWGLLPPAIGVLGTLTRKRSGVALGLGVGLGQAGLMVAMLGGLGDNGGDAAGLGMNYTTLFHLSVAASIVCTGAALAITRGLAAAPANAWYPVGAHAPGVPAAQPAQAYAPQQARPQVTGQWAADPYGRHQYRLWDGVRWTANVSDNGVIGHDEPVITPPTTWQQPPMG
jgi:hypothetical protein